MSSGGKKKEQRTKCHSVALDCVYENAVKILQRAISLKKKKKQTVVVSADRMGPS